MGWFQIYYQSGFRDLCSSRNLTTMNELCDLCGKGIHQDKDLFQQCRLFAAILGKNWARKASKLDTVEFESNSNGDFSDSSDECEEFDELFLTPDTSFSSETD